MPAGIRFRSASGVRGQVRAAAKPWGVMDGETRFTQWLDSQDARESLLINARAALAAVDLDGIVTLWNPYAETLFGWSAEEATGRHVSELMVLPALAEETDKWLTRIAQGETWETDLPLRRKDGTRLWVHLTASPLRDDSGKVVGGMAVAFDITHRRRAEERLALHFEIAQILSGAETLQSAIQQLLPALCSTLGWSMGDFWSVDPTQPRLDCIEIWTVPELESSDFRTATAGMTLVLGEGLPGRVWKERRPIWIRDVTADPDFPRAPLAAAAGLHSGLAFPFFGREHFYGVIEMFSDEPLAQDDELLSLFGAFGAQLGQFIDRLRAESEARAIQARRGAILASAFDCIVSMDSEGKVIEFNAAAEETFGYTRDEAIGQELADLIIPPDLRLAHKTGLHRFLTTGEERLLGKRIEITATKRSGELFPVELAIMPVEIGGDVLFTGTIRDITQQKRTETEIADLLERERKAREAAERSGRDLYDLQRITDVALSHLNLEELLDELLDRLTEIFQSDALGILIATEDGSRLNLRAQRGLGTNTGIAIPIGEGIAGKIAASDAPLVIPDMLEQEDYRPFFEIGGIRCIIGVPMYLDDQLLGVVMAGSHQPNELGDREVRLLTLAAQRIGTGISNASEYSREHRIADTLQRSLLPQDLPYVPGAKLAVRYLPGGPGTMVGGDWYDAVPLPCGRIGIALGDVTGKGVRAASLMGQVRSALYSYALLGQTPSEVLENLDRMIQSIGPESFATVVYMDFDPATKEIRMANAGHPPPLLKSAEEGVRYVSAVESPPIGVSPEPLHEESVLRADPGSVMVLYSDGLIEKPGGDIDKGLDALSAALQGAPNDDVEAICDHLLQAIFSSREPADDVALAVVRFE